MNKIYYYDFMCYLILTITYVSMYAFLEINYYMETTSSTLHKNNLAVYAAMFHTHSSSGDLNIMYLCRACVWLCTNLQIKLHWIPFMYIHNAEIRNSSLVNLPLDQLSVSKFTYTLAVASVLQNFHLWLLSLVSVSLSREVSLFHLFTCLSNF
jgi:hypothetical protein